MKKKLIVLKIVGVILLVYLIMFFDTNSVMTSVKEVMSGHVNQAETAGTPLSQYNHKLWVNPNVEVSITRLFVMQNFFDGYLWVRYKYTTIENGREELPSTGYMMVSRTPWNLTAPRVPITIKQPPFYPLNTCLSNVPAPLAGVGFLGSL